MKIGLFIPCFVNACYPNVGVACYEVLTKLGYDVEYPLDQTCCGQPMANGGQEHRALCMARTLEKLFASYEIVIGPSASCISFIKKHYPEIGVNEQFNLPSKIYDICEFLHDQADLSKLKPYFPHKVSLHNSCHALRELGLASLSERNEINPYNKMIDLLNLAEGIEVFEPKRVDECCGFGGMFSVEEEGVSVCMGNDKVKDHLSTGAHYIVAPDNSCLMHMQGVIDREGYPIQTMHIIEILNQEKGDALPIEEN